MHVGWPQLIWLVLMSISIARASTRFGERKNPDTYDIVDVLVAPAILFGLLYWGGFFGG